MNLTPYLHMKKVDYMPILSDILKLKNKYENVYVIKIEFIEIIYLHLNYKHKCH